MLWWTSPTGCSAWSGKRSGQRPAGALQGLGGAQGAAPSEQPDAVHDQAHDLELEQAPPDAQRVEVQGPRLEPPQRGEHQQHVRDVAPHQEQQVPPWRTPQSSFTSQHAMSFMGYYYSLGKVPWLLHAAMQDSVREKATRWLPRPAPDTLLALKPSLQAVRDAPSTPHCGLLVGNHALACA